MLREPSPSAELTPLEEYWSWQPDILEELRLVHGIVCEQAQSAGGSTGRALLRYTTRPGKMLRPALVIMGSWAGRTSGKRLAASNPDHIRQIAAAVEVLHLATLIHDDVIDDSPVRRGGPTLHTLYGRRQAVLMGDYLLSRCFSMIAAGTSRENAERLSVATGHMCRGELEQLDGISNPSLSLRQYRRRIARKTAFLFTASLVVGASESGASRADTVALARIGYNLGMGFQIIDDLLDFTGSEQRLGKPVASDLRAGLLTMPVLFAASSRPEIMAMVNASHRSESEVAQVVRLIAEEGGLARTREEAVLYTERADRALERLSVATQRETLTELTQQLLHRRF